MDESRTCQICGQPLKSKQKKYCSRNCADQAKRNDSTTPKTLTCEHCGKPFPYRHDKGVPRKYCSTTCFHQARNEAYKLKTQTQKWCCYCKQHLPLTAFSSPNATACTKCAAQKVQAHIDENKQAAVQYLGGKCIRCGYNKCLAALELHHKDKSKKTAAWTKMRSKNIEIIKKWIDTEGIELVCSNCHREEHYYQFHPDLKPDTEV